jgi:ribonuclease HII
MDQPSFDYEREFWKQGKIVAGADEVGRGALAGPVVASAVAFSPCSRVQNNKIKIADSKKLTALQREKADIWIRENALSFGIGQASVAEINKFGIVGATHKAFRRAVRNIQNEIGFLLVDAFYIPYVRGIAKSAQRPIPKGDNLSISIAAASIVAKVYRDNLMVNLSSHKRNKLYSWHKNKGYGTRVHREAIVKHGPSQHHRSGFLLKIL